MVDQLVIQNGPDPICLGDVNGDASIGVNDMLTILSYFGSDTVVGSADLDNDGVVGVNVLCSYSLVYLEQAAFCR